MDEPLSNLGALLRADMRRMIPAQQRRLGITMLYVMHDRIEAMAMAEGIVLLRSGLVEQDAPSMEISARPAITFAASFNGTPPLNLQRRKTGMVVGGTEGPVLTPKVPSDVRGGVRPEDLHLARLGTCGSWSGNHSQTLIKGAHCHHGRDPAAIRRPARRRVSYPAGSGRSGRDRRHRA
jgi:sn-glycerol 3-phosphate transport system ATP-binding protein